MARTYQIVLVMMVDGLQVERKEIDQKFLNLMPMMFYKGEYYHFKNSGIVMWDDSIEITIRLET